MVELHSKKISSADRYVCPSQHHSMTKFIVHEAALRPKYATPCRLLSMACDSDCLSSANKHVLLPYYL